MRIRIFIRFAILVLFQINNFYFLLFLNSKFSLYVFHKSDVQPELSITWLPSNPHYLAIGRYSDRQWSVSHRYICNIVRPFSLMFVFDLLISISIIAHKTGARTVNSGELGFLRYCLFDLFITIFYESVVSYKFFFFTFFLK